MAMKDYPEQVIFKLVWVEPFDKFGEKIYDSLIHSCPKLEMINAPVFIAIMRIDIRRELAKEINNERMIENERRIDSETKSAID